MNCLSSVQEGTEIVQGTVLFELEHSSIVAFYKRKITFFDGVVEQQDVRNIFIMKIAKAKGLYFGVEILSLV